MPVFAKPLVLPPWPSVRGALTSAAPATKFPIWPLMVVGLGTLVVPLDSAVNIDFPYIVRRFDLTIPMIQWVVISYVLAQTSLMLAFGRIGDMLGYRRVFLFGTGWSVLAFIACALSPSYPVLLAGRVAQGIGAALILSCGPALATSLYPERMRARVLGLYTTVFGIGGALGPSVFGLLVERFGWSAVFSFRAPIALAAFMLAWMLPRSAGSGERGKFDAAGGALLGLALSLMLLALNQLRHARENAPLLGLSALLSVVAFALFYRQERRCSEPIINFGYFRDGDFTMINVMNALVNLAAFSIMLLVPFFLDRVSRLPLPIAGLLLASSPIGIMFAAPLAGRLATGRPPRLIAMIGTFASSVGLFAISFAGSHSGIWLLAAWMFVQGFGVGLFQVAYIEMVTAAIPSQSRGVAGALAMATQRTGTVTGATMLMLIFETLRTASTLPDSDAFVAAFQGTFRLAAAIPAALIVVELVRRRLRPRGASTT